MDFWIGILTSIVSALAGSAFFVWLVKSLISEHLKNAIKHEYDQKLEAHKAQLKAQSDIEIERLKSSLKSSSDVEIERLKTSLSISAAQQNLQFSKLHERRADVIAVSYDKLKVLYRAIQSYTAEFEPAGIAPKEERRKIAADAFNDFFTYTDRKMIFLPSQIGVKIAILTEEIKKAYIEFLYAVELSNEQSKTKKWFEIGKKISTEISAALGELEGDFRVLLGDNSLPPQSSPASHQNSQEEG